jgi:uncharacterized protein
MSRFHEGELEVQKRAGVAEQAGRVGRILETTIDPDVAPFLEERPFLVLASVDVQGRPWASPLTGAPPLIRVLDASTAVLTGAVAPSDPLHANLGKPGPLAVLAIDFQTRSRYRLNGIGEAVPGGFRLSVHEAFGNCRKYIQARSLDPVPVPRPSAPSESGALSASQRRWIKRSDTFFIATAARGGADASHRGGNPEFVRVEENGTLVIPDYSGNNMFQTLGNIALVPRAGLLFVDFEGAGVLQLTGDAIVDWDEEHAAAFPGAHRLLRIEPTRIIETRDAIAVRGGPVERSSFNPTGTATVRHP